MSKRQYNKLKFPTFASVLKSLGINPPTAADKINGRRPPFTQEERDKIADEVMQQAAIVAHKIRKGEF